MNHPIIKKPITESQRMNDNIQDWIESITLPPVRQIINDEYSEVITNIIKDKYGDATC
jgi:hypothetical protein